MKVDIDYSINGVSKIVLFDNFTRLILFDAQLHEQKAAQFSKPAN